SVTRHIVLVLGGSVLLLVVFRALVPALLSLCGRAPLVPPRLYSSPLAAMLTRSSGSLSAVLLLVAAAAAAQSSTPAPKGFLFLQLRVRASLPVRPACQTCRAALSRKALPGLPLGGQGFGLGTGPWRVRALAPVGPRPAELLPGQKAPDGLCLWCQTNLSCTEYPVSHLLPPASLCQLSQARWGVCWVNFEALIIAMAVVGGILLVGISICCCCCCCRCCKGGSRPDREGEEFSRRREEIKQRSEDRKAERKARHDEIRKKYGE
ncbi:hypothetical protein NFI96_026181, partial [Prochilodus magdalenae]